MTVRTGFGGGIFYATVYPNADRYQALTIAGTR